MCYFNNSNIFFQLIKSVLKDIKLNPEEITMLKNEECLQNILEISRKHDLAHLVILGLTKNNIPFKDKDNLNKIPMIAIYRYQMINCELKKVSEGLEKAKIDFILLKGSVIRQFYPQPWMRTSCDIDILVKDEELESAITYLTNELGYSEKQKGDHDVTLTSQSGVNIELHFKLPEESLTKASYKILDNVWNESQKKEGYSHFFGMSDEMFYFHHIAHMAKHFEKGGCGIRPFIDLWILDSITDVNTSKREELLKKGKLYTFYIKSKELYEVWFEGEKHTDLTLKIQDFIISGGAYGNFENKITAQQQIKGGKLNYILSKIFISYNNISRQYPILKKYPVLTPVIHIRRWFKLLFQGIPKVTMAEIEYSQNISNEEAKNMIRLLYSLGLK